MLLRDICGVLSSTFWFDCLNTEYVVISHISNHNILSSKFKTTFAAEKLASKLKQKRSLDKNIIPLYQGKVRDSHWILHSAFGIRCRDQKSRAHSTEHRARTSTQFNVGKMTKRFGWLLEYIVVVPCKESSAKITKHLKNTRKTLAKRNGAIDKRLKRISIKKLSFSLLIFVLKQK